MVRLIECLDEFDQRKLFRGEGCSSLFTYCTDILGLCEYGAYARIEVARASRRFPEILNRLRDGRLTLTNAGLLSPHLTEQNHLSVLDEAQHKRKEDVKLIVARLKPRPAATTLVRRVSAPLATETSRTPVDSATPPVAAEDSSEPAQRTSDMPTIFSAAPRPPVITPLAPELYRVQLTISGETREKLREVQDLMRHSIPSGDAALIFERAISLLLDALRKNKFGHVAHPRVCAKPSSPASRHIPAAVKRAVSDRDKGQCAFVGTWGRCTERGFLEFHHVVPFAAGGMATADNIELRCRAHNAHEAVLYFGEEVARHARRESG